MKDAIEAVVTVEWKADEMAELMAATVETTVA